MELHSNVKKKLLMNSVWVLYKGGRVMETIVKYFVTLLGVLGVFVTLGIGFGITFKIIKWLIK
jgi:hypothetical protein